MPAAAAQRPGDPSHVLTFGIDTYTPRSPSCM